MHPATPLRHDNSFDALRLLFALLVIFTHSFALLKVADPLEIVTAFRYDLGKLGVTGFFAISGYLVTTSWLQKPAVLRFVAARALRIFPGYWLALLFSVFVASVAASHPADFLSDAYTRRWVSHNAWYVWRMFSPSMPGAFEANPVPGGANGSLWTLTYELQCYAAVLVLGVVTVLRRAAVVWLLVAILLVFYFKLILGGGSRFALGYHELYIAFATGMLIATSGYRPTAIVVGVSALSAAAAMLAQLPGERWWYAPLQMSIATLVVWIARSGSLKRLAFRSGDYSYGMYVYAFPIQQLAIAGLSRHATPIAVFAITVASVLPIAALSWHGVEKRALRLVRSAHLEWRPFTRKAAGEKSGGGLAVKS